MLKALGSDAKFPSPLADRKSLPLPCQKSVPGSIVHLGDGIGKATVRWLVIPVVVDAVDLLPRSVTILCSPLIKLEVIIEPFLANSDASTAIVLPSFVGGVVAPVPHIAPEVFKFSRMREWNSVRAYRFADINLA